MPESGTLQQALIQVSDLLSPVATLFEPARAVASFAELGIVATPAQATALAAPVQALTAAIAEMLDSTAALVTAIEADDTEAIGAQAVTLVSRLVTAIESIDSLQGAASGVGVPSAGQFAERLFNMLLVRALEQMQAIPEILELMGVLERTPIPVAGEDQFVSTFHFDKLGTWLSSPLDALADEYGWGSGAFDAPALLERLGRLLEGFNAPAYFDAATPEAGLDFVFFRLVPGAPGNPNGLTLETRQNISPGAIVFNVDDLEISFDFEATLPFAAAIAIEPPAELTVTAAAGTFSGNFVLGVAADRTAAVDKYVVIGEPGGSRLEFGRFGAALGMRIGSDGSIAPSIRGEVSEGLLFVSFANADGFLGTLLGGVELRSEFDLGFGYASDTGLFFEGAASLEIQLPLHISLGPVDLSALTLSAGIDGDTFPTTFSVTIRAELGPLVAVVEDIGLRADFRLTDQRDGNAGPVDVTISFKPPNGVGLSVDAGVVKGGGYLYIDTERGEYAGALELSLLDFLTINAVGVITTRMPDGSDGFSLIAVIGVEFNPGFQLGFGFTLIGVGGLLGLHRTMNLDALAQGVLTGSINSVVFPSDVVANAPRIISDMKTFFPVEQGIFLIGPMMKVGWGTPTLVSLAIGVIIEIPGNIAIVGTLAIQLPHEDAPLIVIKVAFIGAIEFDRKRGWFFAALYDSRVLFMTLEGGIGVLAQFGDDPNFVLSVGGFHPSYNPPALPFPSIPRIAINILNTPVARIRVTCYFAVTSNTVQFGAAAELYFGISIASVEGHLAFDALFQFSPFYFVITISASLSVKLFGAGLFSVRFRGELEGPSPWHVEGTGSISILFWDVDVDFSHTWGEAENTTLPPIAVMPMLVAEFEKIDNWTAQLPKSNRLLVALRDIDAPGELVLHPAGSLRVSQRAVPLGLTIDKVGSQRPSDANRFTVTASGGFAERGKTREAFAIAQYQDMNDNEKLGASDFEQEEAGLELAPSGQQTRSSFAVKRVARYEQVIIDNTLIPIVLKFVSIIGIFFTHFLGRNAAAQSPLSAAVAAQLVPFADKIVVQPAGYVVAMMTDNAPLGGAQTFASKASAQEYMKTAVAQDPKLAGKCHVIRPQEMKLAA